MSLFKRAYLSVMRRVGKSLILFIVVFILGNAIAGSYSIHQSTKNVRKNIVSRLGSYAKVIQDTDSLDKKYSEDPNFVFDDKGVSEDIIKKIAGLDSIDYYDYSVSYTVQATTLKMINTYSGEEPVENTFDLKGVQHAGITDIKNKLINLQSGRTFNDSETSSGKYVTVISDELAKQNGLAIGDTIILKNKVSEFGFVGGEKILGERDIVLEIVGTFKLPSGSTTTEGANDSQLNTIYVPSEVTIQESMYGTELQMQASPEMFEGLGTDARSIVMKNVLPTFYLTSADQAESFSNEAASYLPEFYTTQTSNDIYQSIAGPIASMESMSLMIMISSAIASVLILSLIIILFLRDRKHEMGIYLSLGSEKRGVVLQIVTEVFVVSIVALTLSVFSGQLIAKGLSSNISKMENVEIYDADVTAEEIMDSYTVKITPEYIVVFYAITTTVILLSTVVPTVYITRLNPKKIML